MAGSERVAINVDDARIPDNEGNQPVGTPIFADGDTAYFSSLPIKAMVQKMREAGIPAAVSNTAGTYVCNHLKQGLDMFYGFSGGRFPASVLGAADLAANVLVVFCDRRDGCLQTLYDVRLGQGGHVTLFDHLLMQEGHVDEAAAHIGKFLCDVIEHGSRGLSLWRMDKASHTFNRYRKTLFFLLNV